MIKHTNPDDIAWLTNRRLTKTLEDLLSQRESKGPFTSLTDAGFLDANRDLDPDDFWGEWDAPAIFYEMRHAHDIVSTVQNFKRSAVGSLTYKFECRDDDPTVEQILAKQAVEKMFETAPYQSLNSIIATTYDEVSTYGFCLYEIWIPETGPYAGRLQLLHIPSFLVDYWEVDETETRLTGVRINTGDTYRSIPINKVVWFGKQAYPGNFWGISDLRKIVSTFSAYKQDLQNYLTLRRLQAGILYFQENDLGSNEASWDVAADFIRQYFQGKPSPLILNSGMDIKHLSASQPGIDGASNMLGYFDKKVTAALDSSLNNLGIDGVGSLALGKEVAIQDRERFVAHVNAFMDLFNGDTAPESHLLRTLTRIAGFDADCAPRIVPIDNVEVRLADSIETLGQLVEKGIISPYQIGADNIRAILEDIGLDVSHIQMPSEAPSLDPGGETPLEPTSLSEPISEDVTLMAERYANINFKPPKGVAAAAEKGLRFRRKAGGAGGMTPAEASKEGIGSGVQRAVNLKNRDRVSPKVIKQMTAFFSRHKKNKTINPEFKGKPWLDKGYVAWLLWGGDAGERWANKVRAQMEAADKKEK